MADSEVDDEGRNVFRLTIPPRLMVLPGAAILAGTVIGLARGSRRVSLQFLAENVHRPPRTVQGWYFYNKTKNYKVMLGGLQQAGVDASKLCVTALGWVAIEEGLERAQLGDIREVCAGAGTAGVFSAICTLVPIRCAVVLLTMVADRLSLRATGRTVLLGTVVGCGMRLLRMGRDGLASGPKDSQ